MNKLTVDDIEVPEGMLNAAFGSLTPIEMRQPFTAYATFLQAALLWLAENPIVPSEEELMHYREMWDSQNWNRTQENRGDFFRWCLLEWQRRMFLRMFLRKQERLPSALVSLIHGKDSWTPADILAAYKLGKESK